MDLHLADNSDYTVIFSYVLFYQIQKKNFCFFRFFFSPACFWEIERSLNYNDVYNIHLKNHNTGKLESKFKSNLFAFHLASRASSQFPFPLCVAL